MKSLASVPQIDDLSKPEEVAALRSFLLNLREYRTSSVLTVPTSEESADIDEGDLFLEGGKTKVAVSGEYKTLAYEGLPKANFAFATEDPGGALGVGTTYHPIATAPFVGKLVSIKACGIGSDNVKVDVLKNNNSILSYRVDLGLTATGNEAWVDLPILEAGVAKEDRLVMALTRVDAGNNVYAVTLQISTEGIYHG
jgi:hypothetical protein